MMTPSGNARAALGRCLLLFVASRLLYLVLIDPRYLFILPGDELYVGTIAQELLTGLKLPWSQMHPYWTAWTKGLSARSLASVQRGKEQFEALFVGRAPSALESPLRR